MTRSDLDWAVARAHELFVERRTKGSWELYQAVNEMWAYLWRTL